MPFKGCYAYAQKLWNDVEDFQPVWKFFPVIPLCFIYINFSHLDNRILKKMDPNWDWKNESKSLVFNFLEENY